MIAVWELLILLLSTHQGSCNGVKWNWPWGPHCCCHTGPWHSAFFLGRMQSSSTCSSGWCRVYIPLLGYFLVKIPRRCSVLWILRPTYAATEADSTHGVVLTNSSTFHSRGVMFFQEPSNGGNRPSPLKPPYVCVPTELLGDIFGCGLYLGLFGDFNSYLL